MHAQILHLHNIVNHQYLSKTFWHPRPLKTPKNMNCYCYSWLNLLGVDTERSKNHEIHTSILGTQLLLPIFTGPDEGVYTS